MKNLFIIGLLACALASIKVSANPVAPGQPILQAITESAQQDILLGNARDVEASLQQQLARFAKKQQMLILAQQVHADLADGEQRQLIN